MWIVPLSKRERVKNWLLNTEIIISENEKFIINPKKMEFIETAKLETTIPK
jgi:hypothetical protein